MFSNSGLKFHLYLSLGSVKLEIKTKFGAEVFSRISRKRGEKKTCFVPLMIARDHSLMNDPSITTDLVFLLSFSLHLLLPRLLLLCSFERSQLITAASLNPFAHLSFQPNLLILMGPKRLSRCPRRVRRADGVYPASSRAKKK